jgi:protein-arginine kinase activator protein McsA
VGERYLPAGAADANGAEQLRTLREQLRVAVEQENFELAAELRDRLRAME